MLHVLTLAKVQRLQGIIYSYISWINLKINLIYTLKCEMLHRQVEVSIVEVRESNTYMRLRMRPFSESYQTSFRLIFLILILYT
jgi:hypothetical protein